MRNSLKRIAEHLLASSPARGLGHRIRRGSCLILAYHNITRERVPEGDRSLHLPYDEFRRQLDALAAVPVLPLNQALDGTPDDRPSVVITFDDAYAGAVALGLSELTARRMPATVFVAPGILGWEAMWWDLLASPSAGVPNLIRDRCLDEFTGSHEQILAAATRTGWSLDEVRPHYRIAAEAELGQALAGGNVALGLHTWSHRNLARVPNQEMATEVSRPLEWLRARWPQHTVPLLAYPYGVPAVGANSLAEEGITGAFLVGGGWRGPDAGDPYRIPRLTIPSGLSLDGFRARLAGLWPCH